MARLTTKTLWFTASTSPDVVNYRLYYAVGKDATVDYSSSFVDIQLKTEYDLSKLPVQVEDFYTFAVSAIDDVGNESDLSTTAGWKNVPLDLAAPVPPTAGGIRIG